VSSDQRNGSREKAVSTAFTFDYDGDDLVIRIPRDAISPDEVSRFFDYVLLEAGSRELSLSDDEIAAFANEADSAAWARLRPEVETRLRGG
jgi:hypothetical protein